MHVFNVNAFDFQAVQLFTAKKDVRQYLNGWHISRTHLSATNGHVLIRLAHQNELGDDFPSDGYTFHNVKVPTKRAENGDDGLVMITVGEEEATMEHGAKFVNYRFELRSNNSPAMIGLSRIEGKYPDIDRVIPNPSNPSPNHFNPEYIELIGKASRLLCKGAGISHGMLVGRGDENQATLFSIAQRDDVDMVLMPMNPKAWGDK